MYRICLGKKVCLFIFKVPKNFLRMKVPVWISDITFIPGTDRFATSTRYHQVIEFLHLISIFSLDMFLNSHIF